MDMKARYIIRHHPNLFTELLVETEDGKIQQIEDRWTWAETREYCRRALELRGIAPDITKPEPHTEVFPWVELEAACIGS